MRTLDLGRLAVGVMLVLALQMSLAITLIPVEQSLAAEPPCAIRYMTLNPNREMAGPIVSPGMYSAWTGEGLSPVNWQSSAPSQFRAGWKYTVYIADDGLATVSAGSLWDSSQNVASVHYVNRSSTRVYSVTVCPAGAGGALRVSTEEFGASITGPITLSKGSPGKTFWVTGVSGWIDFLTDPPNIGEWQPREIYLEARSYWKSSVYVVPFEVKSGRYKLIARHRVSGEKFEWEVVVNGVTPPPPPPGDGDPGPCPPMKWFRLNPKTEIAGPLVSPGMYRVWTAKIDAMGRPSNWMSYGPFEFKSNHQYWVAMNDQTQQDGTVSVSKEDVNNALAVVHYKNDARSTEYGVVVCPDGGTPPPPPPPPPPPCPPMRWFRLSPGTEMAGHLVSPGMYQVWTAKIDTMGLPVRWMSYGPFEFKSSHLYRVVMNDQTQQDGTVSVFKEDVNNALAVTYYKNTARSTEYGVVVCPAAANLPPTVTLTYSPGSPTPDDIINFEATASDPNGDQLTYRWFLNGVEQTKATAPRVRWANPTEGAHTMRVVVSDGKGGTAEDSVQFVVSDQTPPPPPPPSSETVIFDNNNIAEVANGPTSPTVFTITASYKITLITNYHWNNRRGATPGTISLKDSSGKILGTWAATGRAGMGGVPNAYWDVKPNILLGPGTYTVVDSDPSTWAYNSRSNNRGFTTIKGIPSASPPPPGTKTIEQTLDTNNNKIIDDLEMLQALQYWIKQQNVPGVNKTIDDLAMLTLLQKWIKGTPVSSSALGTSGALSVQSLQIVLLRNREYELRVRRQNIGAVSLQLFDLTGRWLATRQGSSTTLRMPLSDHYGTLLANGVYLYVVTLEGRSGERWHSGVRKLAVLR